MKSILSIAALTFSLSTMAATTATEGLKSIIEAGTFYGQDCSVTVSHAQDSSSVKVTAFGVTEYFTVMNIATSANYSAGFNEATGEVYGRQSLRFPRYQGGSSKSFYAKKLANGNADISISTISLDHHGEDASTFAACEISK